MARSKNATALFEVIHTAKKPPKSSPTVSVPTPKWWHKSKPDQPKPVAEAAPETAGKQGSWLAAAAKRGVQPTPAARVSAPAETERPYASTAESTAESTSDNHTEEWDPTMSPRRPAPAPTPEPEQHREQHNDTTPKPRFAERFAERFARKAALASRSVVSAPAPVEPLARIEIPAAEPAYEPDIEDTTENTDVPMPIQPSTTTAVKKTRASRGKKDDSVALDRGAKEVRFRLSYGGLISLAFILVLVVALAVLIGSRLLPQANSESADDGKKASDPMMLALTKNDSTAIAPNSTVQNSGVPIPAPTPDQVRPDVLKVNRHPAKLPVSTPSPALTIHPEIPASTVREVGTSYIVMQNWDDKEIAQKACDYLNKNGISCSLVRGLGDWTPRDWYSVVGLQPFAAKDPALGEYQKAIVALGIKFSNKPYNRFEPKAYVWKANSDSRGGPVNGGAVDGEINGEINVDR